MIDKFRLTSTKRVMTPINPHTQYSIKQCPLTINQVAHLKRVPYSEAIGSVLWPMVVSRPDTAYAVGILHNSCKTQAKHTGNPEASD